MIHGPIPPAARGPSGASWLAPTASCWLLHHSTQSGTASTDQSCWVRLVELRWGLPESPRVTHAAAGPGELGGCSAARVPEEALAQLVLGDDVLHPGDVQQGQQHPQELPEEGQPQSDSTGGSSHWSFTKLSQRGEDSKKLPTSKSELPHQTLQHITVMLLNYQDATSAYRLR